MRLRMYVTLPDLASAKQLANDLLLARIEDRYMHFLAKRGTDLGELHEASYLQKTDTVHGAFTGFVVGGIVGVLAGALLVNFPPGGLTLDLVAVLVAAIVGAMLGAWMASMVGAAVPNSRLRQFQADIDDGKVLLMVDVPYGQIAQVRELVVGRHPEAVPGGQESRFPAFP